MFGAAMGASGRSTERLLCVECKAGGIGTALKCVMPSVEKY
jgi:hypothetical protein